MKTNVGIKDGRITGIGGAGSPDITDGVELQIGPNTWPVNGYGLIATAAARSTATCTSSRRGWCRWRSLPESPPSSRPASRSRPT